MVSSHISYFACSDICNGWSKYPSNTQRASLAPNTASQQILTFCKYQHVSLLPMLSAALRQSLSYQPFSMLPAESRPCLPVVPSLQARPGCLPLLVSCHASEHCQSLPATIQAIFDLFISVLALNVLSPFVCTVLEHLSHSSWPFICSWQQEKILLWRSEVVLPSMRGNFWVLRSYCGFIAIFYFFY